MNERIRELAEQAGLKYYNWVTNESNINDGTFKYPRLEDYEKFAELIVRECAKVCEKQVAGAVGTYASAHNNAIGVCIKGIKQHFGVEE